MKTPRCSRSRCASHNVIPLLGSQPPTFSNSSSTAFLSRWDLSIWDALSAHSYGSTAATKTTREDETESRYKIKGTFGRKLRKVFVRSGSHALGFVPAAVPTAPRPCAGSGRCTARARSPPVGGKVIRVMTHLFVSNYRGGSELVRRSLLFVKPIRNVEKCYRVTTSSAGLASCILPLVKICLAQHRSFLFECINLVRGHSNGKVFGTSMYVSR